MKNRATKIYQSNIKEKIKIKRNKQRQKKDIKVLPMIINKKLSMKKKYQIKR